MPGGAGRVTALPMISLLLHVALAASPPPQIPFEKYTLSNGLQVILAPDDSVPFVWVNLWYYVGSKDEVVGRTGFAHLYEHMMFQGSAHMDDDYFQPLQRVGGQVNGTTNLDRTNFFEGVPSEYLPMALFLESDRMGWLLPAMTQEKLDNQKLVVRNERRQRYENRPYGNAWVYLLENMYPEGHPYHTATIGKHADIDAASLEDVQAFFKKWYLPNNASLVVAGDFDIAVAKAQVEQWFGAIPAGTEPELTVAAPVSLPAEKVVRYEEYVPFPKVWLAWHSPAVLSREDAALDILSSVLTNGRDAVLYQKLVYELQIAQDVSAYQASAKLGSMFIIEATAAPGHTSDELVAAIDAVLASLRSKGTSKADIATALTAYEVQFFESIGSIQGKANLLNNYNWLTGDPDYLAEDLARYRSIKKGYLDKVLRTWLPADKRVVMHINPKAAK